MEKVTCGSNVAQDGGLGEAITSGCLVMIRPGRVGVEFFVSLFSSTSTIREPGEQGIATGGMNTIRWQL